VPTPAPESRGWLPEETQSGAYKTHSGADWAFSAWFILRKQSDVPVLELSSSANRDGAQHERRLTGN